MGLLKGMIMDGKKKSPRDYEDIIHLPHPVSKSHPPMSISDRAAQFAPFSALTGHYAALQETARRTEERVELDETAKTILDERLKLLCSRLDEHPVIHLTYFQPDEKKQGGAYISVTGVIKRIDGYRQLLILEDGMRVPIRDVFELEGELFELFEFNDF